MVIWVQNQSLMLCCRVSDLGVCHGFPSEQKLHLLGQGWMLRVHSFGIYCFRDTYNFYFVLQFISADVYGMCSRLFCDFGDEFEVLDTTGEEPKEIFISNITQVRDRSHCAGITLLSYDSLLSKWQGRAFHVSSLVSSWKLHSRGKSSSLIVVSMSKTVSDEC